LKSTALNVPHPESGVELKNNLATAGAALPPDIILMKTGYYDTPSCIIFYFSDYLGRYCP